MGIPANLCPFYYNHYNVLYKHLEVCINIKMLKVSNMNISEA